MIWLIFYFRKWYFERKNEQICLDLRVFWLRGREQWVNKEPEEEHFDKFQEFPETNEDPNATVKAIINEEKY